MDLEVKHLTKQVINWESVPKERRLKTRTSRGPPNTLRKDIQSIYL